jgi:hypothetical protein
MEAYDPNDNQVIDAATNGEVIIGSGDSGNEDGGGNVCGGIGVTDISNGMTNIMGPMLLALSLLVIRQFLRLKRAKEVNVQTGSGRLVNQYGEF